MTTDATGNVLKVPGFTQGSATTEGEVLASYSGLTQKGLTLLKDETNLVLPLGAALKVSGTAKKYAWAAKADAANVVGILRKQVDVSSEDKLANVILAGRVKATEVCYSDDHTTQNSDIGGYLSAAELGTLATALAGRYDAVHKILIF